jgi:pullulanase/glycogen debranching enzyme
VFPYGKVLRFNLNRITTTFFSPVSVAILEHVRVAVFIDADHTAHALSPPSMLTVAPVMNPASGPAKNATKAATSLGSPNRPTELSDFCVSALGPAAGFKSVLTAPGWTMLTAAEPSVPGPGQALADTILYKVHVRGFTATHPGVPPELRGTYAGLAHEAALKHLVGAETGR